MSFSRLALSAIVLTLANCQPGPSGDPPERLDETEANRDPPRWNREPAVVLSVGGEDGPAEHLFHQVAGAFELRNGFVVADGGSGELRYFDAEGRLRFASGGKGAGPGQLRELHNVARVAGDTLLAIDPPRIDWFDDAGHFVRRTSITVEGVSAPPYLPGRVIAVGRHVVLTLTEYSPASTGLFRPRSLYVHMDPTSDWIDTVGVGLAAQQFRVAGHSYFAPAHRTTLVAAGRDLLYIADTQGADIRVTSLGSGRQRTLVVQSQPQPFTSADRQAFERQYRRFADRLPDGSGANVRFLKEVPYPVAFPVVNALFVDRRDCLWVRRTPAGYEPGLWTVFNVNGDVAGMLTLADQFEPMDTGPGWVLGRWRDMDDVEVIQRIKLDVPYGDTCGASAV